MPSLVRPAPLRDRPPPGAPVRVAASVLAFALLCAGAGCDRPPDASAPAADTAAQVAADPESGGAASARPGAGIRSSAIPAAARSSTFPHEAHGEVSCVVCHRSVPGHGSHGTLDCGECHEKSGSAGSALTAVECLACHHDPARADPCLRCHERSALPRGRVAVQVAASVREEPVSRALPFAHDRHRGVECETCHTGLPTRSVGVTCDACHDRHHTAAAVCSGCHEPAAPAPHGERAHTGCGGSGCHQDAAVLRLPATRPLCLTCHPAQVDHEAPTACVECHMPGFETAGSEDAAPRRSGRAP